MGFAENCGDGSHVWNLVPLGYTSGYAISRDIRAGKDAGARSTIFWAIADAYVIVEGGLGVAQGAREARARGSALIPLMRTRGASSGMFGFPSEALEAPSFATEKQWQLLRLRSIPVGETAIATADILASFFQRITEQRLSRPRSGTELVEEVVISEDDPEPVQLKPFERQRKGKSDIVKTWETKKTRNDQIKISVEKALHAENKYWATKIQAWWRGVIVRRDFKVRRDWHRRRTEKLVAAQKGAVREALRRSREGEEKAAAAALKRERRTVEKKIYFIEKRQREEAARRIQIYRRYQLTRRAWLAEKRKADAEAEERRLE